MARGSVLKRGDSWLLKYDIGRDLTGARQVRYKTVRGTKKDAHKELHKLLNHIEEGIHVDPSKMTVANWIDVWLKDYSQPIVTPKTHERYTQLLRIHVLPRLGALPIQKLSAPHIQQLYSHLRSEGLVRKKGAEETTSGLSEHTILHVHRVLKNALSEAVRSRVMLRNPLSDLRAPRKESASDATVHALDANGVAKLLAQFREHPLLPIVAFAISTGMRRGEIIALAWSDLDLEKGTVLVQRSIEETKNGGIRFKTTKNKSSRRVIGIDASLITVMKRHRSKQIQDALMLGKKLGEKALVFPKSPLETDTPLRGYNISRVFGDHAKKVGFETIRFHDLRHTHATLLMLEGVPVNAVAQRLGHSSPVITLSVYGHVLKRAEDHAVKVSGTLLSSMSGM